MKRICACVSATVLLAVLCPGLALADAEDFPIPAGTTLRASLNSALSTRYNKDGDPFTARVTEPIFSGGEEVVLAGSTVEGHISFLKEPGRATGVAEMRLVADTIVTPGGTRYDIRAGLEDLSGGNGKIKGDEGTIAGENKSKKDAGIETGVGAGAGAGIGAIADGGTGALYGAAIGAGAAVIHRLSKKHKDIILPIGTEMTFTIARTTTAKRIPKPGEASSSAEK